MVRSNREYVIVKSLRRIASAMRRKLHPVKRCYVAFVLISTQLPTTFYQPYNSHYNKNKHHGPSYRYHIAGHVMGLGFCRGVVITLIIVRRQSHIEQLRYPTDLWHFSGNVKTRTVTSRSASTSRFRRAARSKKRRRRRPLTRRQSSNHRPPFRRRMRRPPRPSRRGSNLLRPGPRRPRRRRATRTRSQEARALMPNG